MKKILSLVLSILFIFSLCSCSGADEKIEEKAKNQSSEHPAVIVIKTYVKALMEYDVETQKKCLDPSVNSFSNALVDTIGGFFNLSDASGMADGAAGMLGSAFEMSSDIEIGCKFVKTLDNNLSEKNGDITVQYKLTVADKNGEYNFEQDISWRFYMVCKDSKWYILSYDDPIEVSDAQYDSNDSGGTDNGKNDSGASNDNTVGGKATRFVDPKHFMGGYAVVQVVEGEAFTPDTVSKPACIDTNGIIQFFYPEGYVHSLPEEYSFYNGICVIRSPYSHDCKIMTNTGKELYSTDTGSVENLSESGFSVIENEIDTYYESKTEYGLMDNQGNWVFELSDKYYIGYNGGGWFYVTEHSDDGTSKVFYYDSNTGETTDTYQSKGSNFVKNRTIDESNGFVAILDEEGNIVGEPIEGELTEYCFENIKYSDCVSIERDSSVYYYDLDGNLLFETEKNVDIYSDGLLLWNNDTYLDKKGTAIIKTEIRY